MRDHTQHTAEISLIVKLHIKLLESRFRTAKGSLEMLTVFKYPNLKSVAYMIEDSELLLDAARDLHQAMVKCGNVSTFEEPAPRVDMYAFLSETQGQAENASQPAQQPAPKASNQDSKCKSEFELTFEDVTQLAKERLESRQKLKEGFAHIKTKDWVQLLIIKSEKAYKGLQVEIDGQQTTIKTFADYCIHAVGLTVRMVNRYLDALLGLGPELFEDFLALDIGEKEMRKACELSTHQKQTLLQLAKNGDKAGIRQFIRSTLEAGE